MVGYEFNVKYNNHLIFMAWLNFTLQCHASHGMKCGLMTPPRLCFSLNVFSFLYFKLYLCRKNSAVVSEKIVSMEWMFNDHFCLSNIKVYLVRFELLFLLGRARYICNPVFPDFSFSFLSQNWLLETNQFKSSGQVANWNYEISCGFCNFFAFSRLFLTV